VTHQRESGHGVDLDLLADYVGGALDGTPEASAVERLIAGDPGWARAYAETSAAVEAVRVDLGTLAAVPEKMPPDVVGRLAAALGPVPPAAGGRVTELAHRRTQPRDRPWTRRLAPLAVAASVLISVGLGATLLRPGGATDSGSTTSAEDSTAENGAAAPPAAAGGPQVSGGAAAPGATQGDAAAGPLMDKGAATAVLVLTTGTDYTRDALALPPSTLSRRATGPSAGPPAALSRLNDRAALAACLAEVRRAAGRPAGSVRLVDLAWFEGSPAVVVLLTDLAWVSGPECGLSGDDTRFSTPVQPG
jgi:hypothetical protein